MHGSDWIRWTGPVKTHSIWVLRISKPFSTGKQLIKNILLDQDLIRGIGNGYSDEILWEARISPYSIASAIPDKKIKELVKIIPKVLLEATKKIDEAYPGRINDEVKEFLIIHRKVDALSPTGHPIKIDTKGSRKTYYTDEQVLYE